MTDQETWDLAVAAVTVEFSLLASDVRAVVAGMAERIKASKSQLYAIVDGVDAGSVCAACGGDCCRTGKYHFTVVDLLVYLSGEKELFMPRFGRDRCPYLGEAGCLMPPAWRPFTCVIFNCDSVELLLGQPENARIAALERELRGLYLDMEERFGNRFMGGLLINCQRNVVGEGGAILKEKK